MIHIKEIKVQKYSKDKKIAHLAGGNVASQVEICAILKWFMRKLEIFGSFKFACAILKLCIAF